jgi:hypothetical protein
MTTGSTAGSGEAEALGPGTYFSGAAESVARHLLRAESCVTDIACAWLPDHDLSGLGKDYGLDLASEPSICEGTRVADSSRQRSAWRILA